MSSHPLDCIKIYDATIAASMHGTAAATAIVSSATQSYAKSWEIFNLTGKDMELCVGADPGSASWTSVIYCPAATASAAQGQKHDIAYSSGMNLYLRTTENVPRTIAATNPFVINLWG